MTTRRQFVAAAKRSGATTTITHVGIHFTIRVEAPAGMRFKGHEFHETVVPSYGAYDFDAAMADLAIGFEPCDEPACEWCHGEGGA